MDGGRRGEFRTRETGRDGRGGDLRRLGLLLCLSLGLVLGLGSWMGCGAGPAQVEPGQTVERRIGPGEAHRYAVDLAAGEVARGVVEQGGIDLRLKVLAPDGTVLDELDAPTTGNGPEPLSILARRSGRHEVVVEPVRSDPVPASYQLTLLERRAALPADEVRLQAERLLSEAGAFHWEGTRASFARAVEAYEGALEGFRQVGAPREVAYVLLNLAEVQQNLGDPYHSDRSLEEALEIFRRLGDRIGETESLGALGYNETTFGRLQSALEYYDAALELSRQTGARYAEANNIHNIANVYQSLGDLAAAEAYFRQALEVMRRSVDRRGEAYALSDLGEVLGQQGREGEALDHLEEALRLRREVGEPQGVARTLAQIGRTHAAAGQVDPALDYLRRAYALAQEVCPPEVEAQIALQLGALHEERGEPAAALESFEAALARSRGAAEPSGEAGALYGIARLWAREGRLEAALERIEEALEVVEALRTEVAGQDLRASYLATLQGYYELAIDLSMRLQEDRPGEGYLARAFQLSERARARSFLETLGDLRTGIRQGIDEELLEREAELSGTLNDLAERRYRWVSEGDPASAGDPRLSALDEEIEKRLREYRILQAEIRAASPRYAELVHPSPVSLSQAQSLLDDDAALLEIALGEERSFLWLLRRDSAAGHVLPGRGRIEAATRRVRELIQARNVRVRFEIDEERRTRLAAAEADLPAALQSLADLLFGEIRGDLDARRLVLVVDGPLAGVPFAALPFGALAFGGPGAEGRTLAEEFELVRLPSASVLAELRRAEGRRDPPPGALAVLADPVFSPADPRLHRAARSPSAGARSDLSPPSRPGLQPRSLLFPRLPSTRREAQAILALAPAGSPRLAALGFEASRNVVDQGGLADYRIVHFATHALINGEHPELSGIVLSLYDEAGHPRDGFLRLHEIYNLRLGADLVVLSACRTALGREVGGEGLVGLTRGFLYAGATRVVATLWEVDDQATAVLMTELYRGLFRDALPPTAALRQAQRRLAADPRWSSPYFWAGFVLQGDWR